MSRDANNALCECVCVRIVVVGVAAAAIFCVPFDFYFVYSYRQNKTYTRWMRCEGTQYSRRCERMREWEWMGRRGSVGKQKNGNKIIANSKIQDSMLLPCRAAIFLTFFGWIIKNVIVVFWKRFLSNSPILGARWSMPQTEYEQRCWWWSWWWPSVHFFHLFSHSAEHIGSHHSATYDDSIWTIACARLYVCWTMHFLCFRCSSCLTTFHSIWRKDPFKFKLFGRWETAVQTQITKNETEILSWWTRRDGQKSALNRWMRNSKDTLTLHIPIEIELTNDYYGRMESGETIWILTIQNSTCTAK